MAGLTKNELVPAEEGHRAQEQQDGARGGSDEGDEEISGPYFAQRRAEHGIRRGLRCWRRSGGGTRHAVRAAAAVCLDFDCEQPRIRVHDTAKA